MGPRKLDMFGKSLIYDPDISLTFSVVIFWYFRSRVLEERKCVLIPLWKTDIVWVGIIASDALGSVLVKMLYELWISPEWLVWIPELLDHWPGLCIPTASY